MNLVEAEPEPECRVDADCPSKLACMEGQRCDDPCRVNNPCQRDQECSVIDTLPTRTVVCACPANTVAGNNGECKRSKFLYFWLLGYFFESFLFLQTVTGSPACTVDEDCRTPEVCQYGSCVDACLITRCGSNAICETGIHSASCQCPPGYTGDPNRQCLYSESFCTPCTLSSSIYLNLFPIQLHLFPHPRCPLDAHVTMNARITMLAETRNA